MHLAAESATRLSRLSTETKAAFKTTEFYAYVVTFVLILIAGAQIEEKNNVDAFRADKVWLYITILTVGYMISRGLAKSGSREPYWEESGRTTSATTATKRSRDLTSPDVRLQAAGQASASALHARLLDLVAAALRRSDDPRQRPDPLVLGTAGLPQK